MKINNPNFDVPSETIEDFLDDGIAIIVEWRKIDLSNPNNELLLGIVDNGLIRYVIESYNIAGMEGQSSDSSAGNTRVFRTTPESNLKSSLSQRL